MFKVICGNQYQINENLLTLDVKSISRPSVALSDSSHRMVSSSLVCVTVEFNKNVDKILKNV